MPYAQFQGEKKRKSIACALASFLTSSKNLYRLRKRFHYWFCCLFVVYSINPVRCSASGELRDRHRSNALRNFWLMLFFKFHNNIADDCNSGFITYVRQNNNLHRLTNWFYNKNKKKKVKLTLSATNISIPIFSSPAQKCSMVSWCRLHEFSSPWWLSNYWN